MNNYNLNDTIFAPITNISSNAPVSIIRIDGVKSTNIIKKIFYSKNTNNIKNNPRIANFGIIKYNNKIIDEVLVTYFKKPKSFTGNDIIEINCHGNTIIIETIFQILIKLGCRLAYPGEFLWRAVNNKKISVSQAEYINEVITQENKFFFEDSNKQKSISNFFIKIYEHFIEIKALLESNIDFSDQNIEIIERTKIQNLLNNIITFISNFIFNAETQLKLKHGLTCIILGNVNVGKSTLFNYLVNSNRSIVTEIAGTTRDIVSEYFYSNNIKIKLLDTPGLRKTKNNIEEIGINKTYEEIKNADFAIFLIDIFDRNFIIEEQIFSLLDKNKLNYILLFNKIDKNQNLIIDYNSSDFTSTIFPDKFFDKSLCLNIIPISLLNNYNVHLVIKTIDDFTNKFLKNLDGIYINIHRLERIKNIYNLLINLKNDFSSNIPLEIISESINIILSELSFFQNNNFSDDVLSYIFSKFCIGK